MLRISLLVTLLSILFAGVQTQATQTAGSAQKDTHGLFNVYFIPAYRVATNRTLKAPTSNSGIVFHAGLVAPRSKSTTTTERPVKISGAASDIHSEQQNVPQTVGSQQQVPFPIRTQASAITQYLIGLRHGYQQPNRYQQHNVLQQQHNVLQQQHNVLQQQQQFSPIPPGYYPFPTRSTPSQQFQGYYPFPPVYIPPSIIPKSATEPPALPPINANIGTYRAAASVKDESVIKSAQISVTPTLATAGPIYATAADDIQTTIEPSPNTTTPDVTVTTAGETSTNPSNKTTTQTSETQPETPKTSAAITSAPTPPTNSTASDSTTSPASAPETRTSPSPDNKPKAPESSSTEKAQAEEHRSISRHFEFSEDKEHSQVNATGDIRLTATRKTSMEGEASQKTPAPAVQGLNSPFPTFPSLPLNTPHPHSHPHPAIIQGPNGFFVGSYNPSHQVGVVAPPSNDPYNSYNPFGHSAALSQVHQYPVQPTLPNRYEDLYYGFAPGFPFGVPPTTDNATLRNNNVVLPRSEPQSQQQPIPPNQPLPVYHAGSPRQFFDVAGPRPYSLPQQIPYNGYSGYSGYNAQPFQPPGDYSRFSNEVLQPPVGRPYYAGDPALPNRGYVPDTVPTGLPNRGYVPDTGSAGLPNRGYESDTASAGLPNRLYSGDLSGPSAPSRLYNPDPGVDPLLNRGFVGGPPPFLTPGFSRSDSAEANSGLTNFVHPVRGIGTAYEVKPGSENTLDNYDRRASRRDSIEADGDSEQVVY